MKKDLLNFIQNSKREGRKLIAILIDPDKVALKDCKSLADQLNQSSIDLVFVGGSTVEENVTEEFLKRANFNKPVALFPGNTNQITEVAEAILFLSLLSGDNPEYLVHQQIKAAPLLQKSSLEIIPTGYILIDGGNETAVQRISKTKPILQNDITRIQDTALAAVYLGKQLVYLEAGSGAKTPVSTDIISTVSQTIDIPLIVGGGIRSKAGITAAFNAGADIVVVGTAFEEDSSILESLSF